MNDGNAAENISLSMGARANWPWRGALLALLAAPSLFMIRPLLDGAIPWFMDTLMYFFPLRVHAAHLLARGEFPTWNACIMRGMPLFANPQAALPYPLHWPMLAWPNGFWFLFPMTLQLGLYSAATAWMLRKAGCGRAASLWGGALALAGAYGWSRFQFGNYLNVIPWWPVWLGAALAYCDEAAGTKEANRKKLCIWLALGAAAVMMMALGGAHQICLYGIIGLGGISLIQVCFAKGRRRAWLGFFAVTFVSGIAMGAPGWLPQILFITMSDRSAGIDTKSLLGGAFGGAGEMLRCLSGEFWLLRFGPDGHWADSESAAVIGPLALLLALVPPRAGRRGLWAALWIIALASAALTLREVMAPVLQILPLASLFHDPRRWLGLTQWTLITASALSIEGIFASIASRPALKALKPALAAAMVFSILHMGVMTWSSTDLACLPAKNILEPETPPLILEAGLKTGERFFTMDFSRASSYDYRRPDLLDWMLPNLGQIWDLEDAGGYEPAQSKSYKWWIEAVHTPEPWRQPYPNHFGHIQNPFAVTHFAQFNIRAAVLPRFGAPLFMQPQRGNLLAAPWPKTWKTGPADGIGPVSEMDLIFVMAAPPGATAPQVYVKGADGQTQEIQATPPRSLKNYAAQDDLVLGAVKPTGNWRPPAGLEHLSVVRIHAKSPTFAPGMIWVVPPKDARILDGFYWNDDLRTFWKPVAARGWTAVMRLEVPEPSRKINDQMSGKSLEAGGSADLGDVLSGWGGRHFWDLRTPITHGLGSGHYMAIVFLIGAGQLLLVFADAMNLLKRRKKPPLDSPPA